MRTNLNVPFGEKDEAKRMGARWDAASKTWFVENVENIARFLRWVPSHKQAPHAVRSDRSQTYTGSKFFRINCACPPWDPCQSCLTKVEVAAWGAPA